ncbi:MAG: hypothetical protein NC394_04955 [Bacteroides sp.]|nr:hypothetical protein [Bacteroides sp.]
MKNNKKPNRTFIKIIKAFLFGIAVGMVLPEYIRNRKRPVLALPDEINETEES